MCARACYVILGKSAKYVRRPDSINRLHFNNNKLRGIRLRWGGSGTSLPSPFVFQTMAPTREQQWRFEKMPAFTYRFPVWFVDHETGRQMMTTAAPRCWRSWWMWHRRHGVDVSATYGRTHRQVYIRMKFQRKNCQRLALASSSRSMRVRMHAVAYLRLARRPWMVCMDGLRPWMVCKGTRMLFCVGVKWQPSLINREEGYIQYFRNKIIEGKIMFLPATNWASKWQWMVNWAVSWHTDERWADIQLWIDACIERT